MEYISITQLSERWQVTPRYIQNLCREGRLSGAVRIGKMWMLPEDVERPADRRCKATTQENMPHTFSNEICWSSVGGSYRVPGTKDELLKTLADTPEALELTKAQFTYLHGDIDSCLLISNKLFYESYDFEIKIGSAFLLGLCALYKGNVAEWLKAKTLIENLGCPDSGYIARKELWLAVYGATIYDMSGYPEWFRRGCFDSLPAGYHPIARLHYIKYIYIRGDAMLKNLPLDDKEFARQLILLPAICEPLISQTILDKAIVSEIYLRLLCASSYHHSGEDSLAIEHINRAIALALPDEIYAPFAEQRPNLDSLVDEQVKMVSPEAYNKIKALSTNLMKGWSHVHNTVLGRNHTTVLTSKELEAARLAVFGLTNGEIATRMGISINSVKAYLQSAKDKIGIKKRSEFAKYV